MNQDIKTTAFPLAMVLLLVACGGEDPAFEQTIETRAGALSRVESTETGNGSPRAFDLSLVVNARGTRTIERSKQGPVLSVPVGRDMLILTRFGGRGDLVVIDGNGTDGFAAFGLPGHGTTGTDTTYAIAARVQGAKKIPNTAGCVTTPTAERFCAIHDSTVGKTGPGIQNLSVDLLFADADLDGDGKLERAPLFDPRFEGLYWKRDASGAPIADLRFMPVGP